MLFSINASAWELVNSSNMSASAVVGNDSRALWFCSYTNTSFDSCMSEKTELFSNQYLSTIENRAGDAYVYYQTWGSKFLQASSTVQGITFGAAYWRMLRIDYDPVNPQLPAGSTGGSSVYGVPATDQQCQSQYSGSFTRIPNIDLNQALAGVDIGACRFVANPNDTECYNNDGNQFCYSTWDVSSNGNNWYPGNPGNPVPTNDLPEYLTPTDDTSSCEYGSVAYGGQSYCYNSDVSDSTERSPGYGSGGTGGGDDGGGDGGSGGDGDGSGGGSGGTGGGGYGDINIEVPGLEEILSWLQTEPSEAEPDYPEDGLDAITREINVEDYTVNWSSGLSGGSCPGPEVVGLGRYGSITISYDGFCQFAGLLRYLVIAAAYASAAFLTFRGLV